MIAISQDFSGSINRFFNRAVLEPKYAIIEWKSNLEFRLKTKTAFLHQKDGFIYWVAGAGLNFSF